MAPPKKYPDELRERAVRLWREAEPRPPIVRLAHELGIHREALRSWIRQDQMKRGELVRDRRSRNGSDELERLRSEILELRRLNEALKTACAIFASELDRQSREDLPAAATGDAVPETPPRVMFEEMSTSTDQSFLQGTPPV